VAASRPRGAKKKGWGAVFLPRACSSTTIEANSSPVWSHHHGPLPYRSAIERGTGEARGEMAIFTSGKTAFWTRQCS
jgi:hypothetical protein